VTEPIRLRVRLPASTGAVWHALTDAPALRHWLAEHAEAGTARHAFWGRFTPYGDRPAQRLIHLGEEDTLRFSWTLDGHDTTVETRVRADGPDATVLTISQTSFDGDIAGYPVRIALLVFWSLALGNLADHLTGRPITPRCDYTSSGLRAEFVIAAPRPKVFGSLTDPAIFSRWFGLPVEIEPYAGGRWSIGGGGPVGRVRDVREGTRLVLQEDTGIATWELTDDGGTATRVRFGLSGYDPARPPHPGWTGWLSAMSSLRRYHEIQGWRPLWLDAS
jgi:uncharacterized protein YndB with AHSA1/START domain